MIKKTLLLNICAVIIATSSCSTPLFGMKFDTSASDFIYENGAYIAGAALFAIPTLLFYNHYKRAAADPVNKYKSMVKKELTDWPAFAENVTRVNYPTTFITTDHKTTTLPLEPSAKEEGRTQRIDAARQNVYAQYSPNRVAFDSLRVEAASITQDSITWSVDHHKPKREVFDRVSLQFQAFVEDRTPPKPLLQGILHKKTPIKSCCKYDKKPKKIYRKPKGKQIKKSCRHVKKLSKEN